MEIKLEAFEGPLDLLLHLIRRSEIDILNIPIAQITDEYLEIIKQFPPQMNEMSEFLVMAATLLEIKSRMLLPRPKAESGEPQEDPRETLARKLLAYQEAQDLAAKLDGLSPVGERLKHPEETALFKQLSDMPKEQPMELVPIEQLAEIFDELVRRAEERIDLVRSGYGEMPREKHSVTAKISYISDCLLTQGRLSMIYLFEKCRSKHEMIVTFLALLEMIRRGLINAFQNRVFGDVEVSPCRA